MSQFINDLFDEYAEAKDRLEQLETQIKEYVTESGNSVSHGRVQAKYSTGRKTYQYEKVGKGANEDIIKACTTPKVDWKTVCKLADIEEIPFSQAKPTVSIKVEKNVTPPPF